MFVSSLQSTCVYSVLAKNKQANKNLLYNVIYKNTQF